MQTRALQVQKRVQKMNILFVFELEFNLND